MRLIRSVFLYLALLSGANAALADVAALKALRDGDMKKLSLHSAPKPASGAAFVLADEAGEGRLSDYAGRIVLLNFWATWCAPCRKEMPHLDALQRELGGADFQVLTLATGRNSPHKIRMFFEQNGITALPRHQDPKQAVAREMAVLGLPVTVILDREGQEIGRLQGDADWNSESAKAIIRALVQQQ